MIIVAVLFVIFALIIALCCTVSAAIRIRVECNYSALRCFNYAYDFLWTDIFL